MKTIFRVVSTLLASLAATLFVTEPASAYGGPGSIISGIGALLAVVAAVLAAIFGFIWYPLKRLVRRMRGEREEPDAPVGGEELAPK